MNNIKKNPGKFTNFHSSGGFTMLELVVVIIIMGVLSAVAIRSFTKQTDLRKFEETRIEMGALKRAIVGDPDRIQDGIRVDYGYVGDMGFVPSGSDEVGLSKLVTDPGSPWNGPYMAVNFSDNPFDYRNDAYGKPYAYDPVGMTIYSTGANITLQITSDLAGLTNNTVTLIIRDIDGDPIPADTSSFTIVLNLQNQTTITGIVVPASGFVQIPNVPIGNHTLVVSYPGLPNVIKRVSVDPSFTLAPIDVVFSFP